MASFLLNCLHAGQLLNQTLLPQLLSIVWWRWGLFSQTFSGCFFCACLWACVCVFSKLRKKNPRRRDQLRDGELWEGEWESWDESLTWSFLMMQKWPVSLKTLLRLQTNVFLVFAPEKLTDHRPVCSLSKDSCLWSGPKAFVTKQME